MPPRGPSSCSVVQFGSLLWQFIRKGNIKTTTDERDFFWTVSSMREVISDSGLRRWKCSLVQTTQELEP